MQEDYLRGRHRVMEGGVGGGVGTAACRKRLISQHWVSWCYFCLVVLDQNSWQEARQ